MKSQTNSTENCHFYSREKSMYIAWACFRNVILVNFPCQCRLLKIVVNSLHSNCLALIIFLKDLIEKLDFEEKPADNNNMQNCPACK